MTSPLSNRVAPDTTGLNDPLAADAGPLETRATDLLLDADLVSLADATAVVTA